MPAAKADFSESDGDLRPALVRGLLRARAYPHDAGEIRVVETHISWVFLTGRYAYKVKKPVKLHFLDYSTLAKREHACEAELALNRRLAPDLYVDVVPITGAPDHPQIGGSGHAIEYAVRMHEFRQSRQADRLLAHGRLEGEALEHFARRLAAFHETVPRTSARSALGGASWVRAPLAETLEDLAMGVTNPDAGIALAELRAWCDAQAAQLAPTFAARKRDGFVREGHGDLHLANLVLIEDQVTAFDCIEFNDQLRWGDVIGEVAFLAMDLLHHRRPDLAYRFLNAYLEATGDYAGIAVYRYYLVYRALVRAKVEMIRRDGAPAAEGRTHAVAMGRFIRLAHAAVRDAAPALLLMHGYSGSGKTHLSSALAPLLPAIRIRSDVERKRMHGFAPLASTGSPLSSGIYASSASRRTYAQLARLAEPVLIGGEKVIVDAAFLRRAQRRRFEALARRLDVPFAILDCRAPVGEMRRRILARAAAAHDASEANSRILQYQLAHHDALGVAERKSTFTIDTTASIDLRRLAVRRETS